MRHTKSIQQLLPFTLPRLDLGSISSQPELLLHPGAQPPQIVILEFHILARLHETLWEHQGVVRYILEVRKDVGVCSGKFEEAVTREGEDGQGSYEQEAGSWRHQQIVLSSLMSSKRRDVLTLRNDCIDDAQGGRPR